VRVGKPAANHGVPEDDIWHALRDVTRRITDEDVDDDLLMLIGPARDGTPLELGVLGADGDDPVVIHAMPLRPKFRRFLR
jgi:hypothetical protein